MVERVTLRVVRVVGWGRRMGGCGKCMEGV